MARPGGIPGGFPPRRIPGAQSPPVSPYRGTPLDVGLTRGHRAQGDVCAELQVPPRGEGSGVREQASGSSPARPCTGLRGGGRGGRPQPPTRGRCGDCDRAGETGRCRGGLKVGASQAPGSPRGGLSGGAPQRPCWDGEGHLASAPAKSLIGESAAGTWLVPFAGKSRESLADCGGWIMAPHSGVLLSLGSVCPASSWDCLFPLETTPQSPRYSSSSGERLASRSFSRKGGTFFPPVPPGLPSSASLA